MTLTQFIHRRPLSGLATPPSVLALPLFRRAIFPGIVAPIVVPNERFASSLQALRNGLPMHVGLFLAKDNTESAFNRLDHIHGTGILTQALRVFPHKVGQSQVVVVGLHRIKATDVLGLDPFRVFVEPVVNEPYTEDPTPLVNEIVLACKEIVALRPLYKDQYATIIEQVDLSSPADLADCVAGLVTHADAEAGQALLQCTSVPQRLTLALAMLRKEVVYGQAQAKIHRASSESESTGSTHRHRRIVLLDQMKAIKKELGMEADEKDVLLSKFQSRCATRRIPDSVQTTIDEECAKLAGLEPTSSEFAVTRNYIDWLTVLPWGNTTTERFDLIAARDVLDADHFGLDDVKKRVLELIAVGALKGSVRGKILCLVGPPGTGKTSVARSIARALHRPFFRFSVGGMTDVAEIKGHRRTYVGAMPGKLIQSLKVTQTSNPVLLIDEIDKVGRGVAGDPGAALLEVGRYGAAFRIDSPMVHIGA